MALSLTLSLLSMGLRVSAGVTIGGLLAGKTFQYIHNLSKHPGYHLYVRIGLKIAACSAYVFVCLSYYASYSLSVFYGACIIAPLISNGVVKICMMCLTAKIASGCWNSYIAPCFDHVLR